VSRRILILAAAAQTLLVGALSVALVIPLGSAFFKHWGWLIGPGAWLLCAFGTALLLGLPRLRTLTGAAARRDPERDRGPCRRAHGRRGRRDRPVCLLVRVAGTASDRRPQRLMDFGIEGKVALVMGASKGIGRAVAVELAGEGARVAIAARSLERLEPVTAEIGASAFEHDSADLDGVPALIANVEQALGPIEILVTNTGGPPANPDPLGQLARAVGAGLPSARALPARADPRSAARRCAKADSAGSSTSAHGRYASR
jgi:hypothetical protein